MPGVRACTAVDATVRMSIYCLRCRSLNVLLVLVVSVLPALAATERVQIRTHITLGATTHLQALNISQLPLRRVEGYRALPICRFGIQAYFAIGGRGQIRAVSTFAHSRQTGAGNALF